MMEAEDFTILHFNDVYHISDAEHVARFASVLSDPHYVSGPSSPKHLLRIFSGDVFSPSLEASVLQGGHMPDLLNALRVDVACYGNHDFDFGEDRLVQLSKRTVFPWTLTNAVRERGQLLAQAREFVIKEVAGFRIGFFGLAGTDWPSNCQRLPSCEILDPVAIAKKTAQKLRQLERCDLVVALTHMRLAEDVAVSRATESGSGRVDMLLGGHDHQVLAASADYDFHPEGSLSDAAVRMNVGDVRIVKSGTDWRGLSIVHLKVARATDGIPSIQGVEVKQIEDLRRIPGYEEIPPCPKVLAIIANIQAKIDTMAQAPLLMTQVPLEGRSEVIRSRETNLGNMLADALRAFYDTDVAIVNSGAIRCDKIIPSDARLSIRDVIDINPFDNVFVVKRVSGRALKEAFENSLGNAHMDGRFLQVSGIRVTGDWARPEGVRVRGLAHLPEGGALRDICPEDMFTVAMIEFIASGFDGYSCFRNAEVVDGTEAMTDTNLLLCIFGAASQGHGGNNGDGKKEGISRARSCVIQRWDSDELPVVSPSIEGRMQLLNASN